MEARKINISYVDSIENEIQQSTNDSTTYNSLNTLSDYYYNNNNLDSMLSTSLRTLTFVTNYYPKELSISLMTVSAAYQINEMYPQAFEYQYKALNVYKKNNNKEGEAMVMNNLGWLNKELGEYGKAVSFFFKALKIAEEIENKKIASYCFDNIGHIYSRKNNENQALKYYWKGLKISRERGDKKLIARGLNNIAIQYRRLKKYIKAINIYTEVLKIDKELKNEKAYAITLANVGKVYYYKKEYNKARDYLNQSKLIHERLGNKTGMINVYNSFGKLLAAEGKQIQSIQYSTKALRLAKKMGFKDQMENACESLANNYAKISNYDSAYYFLKKQLTLKDSLFGIENTKLLNQLTLKYETAKKDAKIKLLKKDRELKDSNFKLTLILSGFMFISLIIVSITWYNKRKKRYENELNDLRALKSEIEIEKLKETIVAIPVKVGKKIILIQVGDIIFFSAENNYVLLNTHNSKSYVIDYTLISLEKRLSKNFVRVHRSYIINKDKIAEIKSTYNGKVVFTVNDTSNTKIPSSLGYSENVKKLRYELALT